MASLFEIHPLLLGEPLFILEPLSLLLQNHLFSLSGFLDLRLFFLSLQFILLSLNSLLFLKHCSPLSISFVHFSLPSCDLSLLPLQLVLGFPLMLQQLFFLEDFVSLRLYSSLPLFLRGFLGHHSVFPGSFALDVLLLSSFPLCGSCPLPLIISLLHLLFSMLLVKHPLPLRNSFLLLQLFEAVLFPNFLLLSLVLHDSLNFFLLTLLYFL